MNELRLDGCRPIPLASYLKALGVLRLVAEQADPEARGFWRGERFHLKTRLDRDGLRRFFLEDYAPTPIIAPWNGGSGFYPKDAKDGINAIAASRCTRLAVYSDTIALGNRLIADRGFSERPTDAAKAELIAAVRAEADEKNVTWLDAAVALTLDRVAFPPLLGTGGNDGRLDFTNNFMQRFVELVEPEGGRARTSTPALLDAALFEMSVAGLGTAAIGQFSPAAAGGVNSTSGYEGASRINGWDYVLMLEGALLFAGGVSRRLEGAEQAYLSYPFTVRAAAAGFGTASLDEQADSRGELWAPLWERPAMLNELRVLFREGRISLDARPARDGLDAARAVTRLGADRRVRSFERFGFVKRQGLAYFATPLGRRLVRPNPAGELLADLDRGRWLDRLRANSTNSGVGLREAVRNLEDGIFELTARPQEPALVQDVLIAVGRVARGLAIRANLREILPPPPILSAGWTEAAGGNDPTPEFRIAAALAGLRAKLAGEEENATEAPPEPAGESRPHYGLYMRQHLAPLDPDPRRQRYPAWDTDSGAALAVWGPGSLIDNLCAVAQRRLLEAHRFADKPFDAPFAADGTAIAALFEGSGNLDNRVAELTAGLAWVEPARFGRPADRPALPLAYAALKPLFAPNEAVRKTGDGLPETFALPIPPAVTGLLLADRVDDAVHLAMARARNSGLPTPFMRARLSDAPGYGRRLLAALTVPVTTGVLRSCLDQAYPSDEETEHAA